MRATAGTQAISCRIAAGAKGAQGLKGRSQGSPEPLSGFLHLLPQAWPGGPLCQPQLPSGGGALFETRKRWAGFGPNVTGSEEGSSSELLGAAKQTRLSRLLCSEVELNEALPCLGPVCSS